MWCGSHESQLATEHLKYSEYDGGTTLLISFDLKWDSHM